MIKLSIIVPIYGVEQYLRKCVDSLLNQDIPSSEYEIILVDDGSPDECPQICDEYAEAHENIHVVHRENGGLSAARNSGIDVAEGEYLMFVDSDDYIEPNVLGALMVRMKDDSLDVLRYNYQNVRIVDGRESRVDRKYEVFEPFKTGKPYFDYSSKVVDGETFLNERLGYACYAWAFVLKRELLDGCIFTPGIYFEDTDWTPRMLLKAKRAASTELVVYNYLWREGSITLPTSTEKKQKILDDRMKLLSSLQEQRKHVANARWYDWQTASLTVSVLNMVSKYPQESRRLYMERLEQLHIYPLSTYRADRNSRIKIALVNLNPILYCILMKMMRR